MDDVRKTIYATLIGFLLILVVWFSFVYVSACGFSVACRQAQTVMVVDRTPIPTLIPATMPVPQRGGKQAVFNKCQVAAVNLIGAWVSAGYPEKDTFTFTDVKGTTCEATFAKDVQPLFLESNLWYPGSLACASCHQSDLTKALMNMDLSSYAGIVAGSRRANGEAKGNDILGGGHWEQSLLYQMLYAPNGQTTIGRPAMPLGRPADVPAEGPLVYAGVPLTVPTPEISTTLPGGTTPAETLATSTAEVTATPTP